MTHSPEVQSAQLKLAMARTKRHPSFAAVLDMLVNSTVNAINTKRLVQQPLAATVHKQ